MKTKDYIQNWIETVVELYPNDVFKYAFFEKFLHIVKYPDCLKENIEFIEQVYMFTCGFREKFNEDILILNESDDYFEVDNFDSVYNLGYIKNNNCVFSLNNPIPKIVYSRYTNDNAIYSSKIGEIVENDKCYESSLDYTENNNSYALAA